MKLIYCILTLALVFSFSQSLMAQTQPTVHPLTIAVTPDPLLAGAYSMEIAGSSGAWVYPLVKVFLEADPLDPVAQSFVASELSMYPFMAPTTINIPTSPTEYTILPNQPQLSYGASDFSGLLTRALADPSNPDTVFEFFQHIYWAA